MKYNLSLTGTSPIASTHQFTDEVAQEIRNGNKDRALAILSSVVRMQDSFELLVDSNDNPNYKYKIEDNHKFLIDFSDQDNSIREIIFDLIVRKEYEPETNKIIKEWVKSGDTVVDVGASIGHFTLLLARQVGPEGKVYAIEPTKNQFPYLLHNVGANGYKNVTCINVGASDKEEMEKFQVNATSRTEPLQGKVLDNILPDKVDFIKIDVDGSEPKVLRGLIKTFQKNPQLKMVIEYYPKYMKNLGNNPQDMMNILDKYFNYRKIEGDYGDGYWNYFCERKV